LMYVYFWTQGVVSNEVGSLIDRDVPRTFGAQLSAHDRRVLLGLDAAAREVGRAGDDSDLAELESALCPCGCGPHADDTGDGLQGGVVKKMTNRPTTGIIATPAAETSAPSGDPRHRRCTGATAGVERLSPCGACAGGGEAGSLLRPSDLRGVRLRKRRRSVTLVSVGGLKALGVVAIVFSVFICPLFSPGLCVHRCSAAPRPRT
jgi:hypothetical protein